MSPGLSMPRSAVYDQLQWHSHQNKLEPISSSSLGKLLNSVFPGVLARRLGTRYLAHTWTHALAIWDTNACIFSYTEISLICDLDRHRDEAMLSELTKININARKFNMVGLKFNCGTFCLH